ncbi:GyrI-like domain-containing protein [Microbacter sp. GSS18]|nr:GyrI-like domain-containing protein [Microbacter sp. GSS18]
MMLDPENPYSDLTFVDLPQLTLAVVRYRQVTLDELRPLFHRAMGPLGAAMEDGGFIPAGPFLAVYSGDIETAFDVAIGFPAEQVDVADGPVEAMTFPPSQAAALSHIGSYEDLGASWGRVLAGVTEAGRTAKDSLIEVYVSDPQSTPPDRVRTDLVAILE